MVTPGAKPILFFVILALVDEGDEVLYPNPGFPIYESMIRYIGGIPVPVRLLEEKAFTLDVGQLCERVGPKTRLIILNDPHNPTGGVIPESGLRAIAEAAARYNVPVLSDEIYGRILYDGEHKSIAAMPGMESLAIVLDGFSKTYAMTGWRLGYGIMPAPMAQVVAKLQTNATSCTATFSQLAAVQALRGDQSSVDAMVAEFRRRRDAIVDGRAYPGSPAPVPRARSMSSRTSPHRLRSKAPADKLLDQGRSGPSSAAPPSASSARGTSGSRTRTAWRTSGGLAGNRVARERLAAFPRWPGKRRPVRLIQESSAAGYAIKR